MKAQARFKIDGALHATPEVRTTPQGKEVADLIIEVKNAKGEGGYYTIRATQVEDVRGMRPGMKLRVEGAIYAKQGNSSTFYNMYAENILPYWEQERQRPQLSLPQRPPQDAPQGYERGGNSYGYGNGQQRGYGSQQEAEEDIPF